MNHRWQATTNHVRSVCCMVCGEPYDGCNYSDPCPLHERHAREGDALRLAGRFCDDPCPLEVADGVRTA